MKQLLLLLILLPFTLVSSPPAALPNQDNPPDVCQEEGNVLPNCNFNNGLDGWQTFTEDGGANFAVLQGGGECHAPLCPAAYIVTEGHFVGGIFQQVAVTKGNTYFANVVWLVFDSLANDGAVHQATGGIGRKVGIDPFGGTDPRSPNVVWGPENWRNDCKICDKQEVAVTAQADTVTVFVRIDNRWKLRAAEQGYGLPPSKDHFWIDDVGMKQVGGEMAAQVSPTETPVPPTDTPAPPTETPAPGPTDTPEPEPTETPEPVETPAEAEAEIVSPLATPTEVPVAVAPPPTLTPTTRPSPTSTPEEQLRATPTRRPRPVAEADSPGPLLSAGLLGVAGTTICAGGVIVVIMGLVMAGMVWLYRLGWGKEDVAEADDEDYGEDVVVEIVD